MCKHTLFICQILICNKKLKASGSKEFKVVKTKAPLAVLCDNIIQFHCVYGQIFILFGLKRLFLLHHHLMVLCGVFPAGVILYVEQIIKLFEVYFFK